MSILDYARPRVKRNTRPATIRPVPATFGVGILSDDPCRMNDAAFEAWLYSDVKPSDRPAVREAERRAKARQGRYPVSPSSLDSAWDLGFRLGREGVDANPSVVYNPRERKAFSDGYDRGLNEFHRDEIAATEAWLAERERMYDGAPESWELAECGSALGHDA